METFTSFILLGGILIGAGVALLLAALLVFLAFSYAKN
jgi:hypothetical protein